MEAILFLFCLGTSVLTLVALYGLVRLAQRIKAKPNAESIPAMDIDSQATRSAGPSDQASDMVAASEGKDVDISENGLSAASDSLVHTATQESPAASITLSSTMPMVIGFQHLNFRQRRAIKKRAERDFRNSRGYVHLELLEAAKSALMEQQSQYNEQKRSLQNKLNMENEAYRNTLRQACERYLISERFDEVPGIGPSLKTRILEETGATRLIHLRRAHTVHGVGANRQREIELWVNRYSSQLSTLVDQPFPGKEDLEARHNATVSAANKSISDLDRKLTMTRSKIETIDSHSVFLSSVEPSDFVEAAQGSDEASDRVNRFMRGAFGEWEPIPDWFKEAVEDSRS